MILRVLALCLSLLALLPVPAAYAQTQRNVQTTATVSTNPSPMSFKLSDPQDKTAGALRIAIILTLLSIIPALLISMTSFTRIIVVLAMIRHAFGMPETPPNAVLVGLAIFLTMFSMMPTIEAVNDRALQPFLSGHLSVQEAIDNGSGPAKDFMLRQVHDRDIKTV